MLAVEARRGSPPKLAVGCPSNIRETAETSAGRPWDVRGMSVGCPSSVRAMSRIRRRSARVRRSSYYDRCVRLWRQNGSLLPHTKRELQTCPLCPFLSLSLFPLISLFLSPSLSGPSKSSLGESSLDSSRSYEGHPLASWLGPIPLPTVPTPSRGLP